VKTAVKRVIRRKLALKLGQAGARLVCAFVVAGKVPQVPTELGFVHPTSHTPSWGCVHTT